METQERFGFKEAIGKPEGPDAERRLHLVALDYWHDLSAGNPMPDFRQLTPDGLSPFRGESLLLDFSEAGGATGSSPAHIRFVGDTISSVLADHRQESGSDEKSKSHGATLSTEALAATDFGRELLAHLRSDSARQKPQEFDYEDDLIGGRGILMPLSLGDQPGTFIWIVATFDFIAYRSQTDSANTPDSTEVFATQLADARSKWEETPQLGAGARGALYQTLQAAYKLFEQAEADPVAWAKLLANSGLRQQKRAPFTPALKLVFGKSHDKTRLTEYAAALAHARRNGVVSGDFIDWIEAFSGGIKGCVEQERLMKKADAGGRKASPQSSLKAAAALARFSLEEETNQETDDLMIAYVRRGADGHREVIAMTPATKQDELRALGLILSKGSK